MSWWTLDVRCTECDHVQEELMRRSEWEPEANDGLGTEFKCGECGSASYRTMSTPNVTRASFVDGTDRFAQKKAINKVRKEMLNHPARKRGEFKKEIKRIKQLEKNRSD